jgi:hypothetical protein
MLKSDNPKLSSHSHHYNILIDRYRMEQFCNFCTQVYHRFQSNKSLKLRKDRYRQDLLTNPAGNRGLLPFRVAAQHGIPGEKRDCVCS